MKEKKVAKFRVTFTCSELRLKTVIDAMHSVTGCKITGLELRGFSAPEDSAAVDAVVSEVIK